MQGESWMVTRAIVLLTALLCTFASAQARVKNPPRDLLGIRLGVSREAARAHLKKIGRLQREEEKRQEVWSLNDPRYEFLLLGYDENYKVRYVTALARKNGRRVRYSDVVDIKKTRQEGAAGNYKYVWEVAARGDQTGYVVIARGSDPRFLSMCSIKRIAVDEKEEDEDRPKRP